MIPGWSRKADKALARFSFEQLTTSGSRRHEKPAPARAIKHALFAIAEKAGNLGHRHVSLRQIVVGTVAPERLDHFIKTSALLGQPSLQHAHVHAELLGNQR